MQAIDMSKFVFKFSELEQEITFEGTLRPSSSKELAKVRKLMEQVAAKAKGTLFFNFKRLQHLNNTAFLEIGRFLDYLAENHPELKVKLLISTFVPWASTKFSLLTNLYPNTSLEHYDKNLYPGQSVIETIEMIPVLRTQTKIIWNLEKDVLKNHGLRSGINVADICCGLGDFSLLINREFDLHFVVGVDHSKLFLDYARKTAKDFEVNNIDYIYGDASNLFLPDNSFDFVACRLSLQIFNQPESILSELYRICKPGGRVYVTNEMKSNIFGYPRNESISWTYRQAVKYSKDLHMDLDFGYKVRAHMIDCKFTDIKIELLDINNLNTDHEDFCSVVQSWEHHDTEVIAEAAGTNPEIKRRMRQGFQDHIYSIRNRRGYAGWPIYAASGSKPYI